MPREIRDVLGERVHMLRRRRGLSQPELARLADMSITTLSRVENGHQSLYMEKVAKLAEVLKTTTDFLLGLAGEPETEDTVGSELLTSAVD